jgi:catechol 2,3-dioxygenase-like lactoylglutathione lyase family enzyme
MPKPTITGLNHLTLTVTDLDRSIDFYRDVLGLALRAQWPEGAYLEAGSLWLCLSIDEQIGDMARGDYTHIAFDVAEGDFAQLGEHIRSAVKIWKNNRSEGQSLYFLDPDGHKLELHVGSLASRLAHYRANPIPGLTTFPSS